MLNEKNKLIVVDAFISTGMVWSVVILLWIPFWQLSDQGKVWCLIAFTLHMLMTMFFCFAYRRLRAKGNVISRGNGFILFGFVAIALLVFLLSTGLFFLWIFTVLLTLYTSDRGWYVHRTQLSIFGFAPYILLLRGFFW